MVVMATARLTPHQKATLDRLTRLSARQNPEGKPTRWIHEKDCGGPAALEHLYRKGYVERELRAGPRGGEHGYYRPVQPVGASLTQPATVTAPVAQTTNEIDTKLMTARRKGEVVRIFVGPAGAEFRGVPGEVARDEDGTVRMQFGARRVALKAITRVEV